MENATKNTLVPKLVKVLAEINRLKKTGRNEFHKYDYATEADILDAVRNKLANAGVFVFTSQEVVTDREISRVDKSGIKKVSIATRVNLKHTFSDGSSEFTVSSFGESEDTGDKGLYKAVTGAMKYFVSKNFLISTGDDPETGSPEEKGDRSAAPPTEWEQWALKQINRAQTLDHLYTAMTAIKEKGPAYFTPRVIAHADSILEKMEAAKAEGVAI